MGKESNAVVLKPVSGSTKEYCVFIADVDLVSNNPSCCDDRIILVLNQVILRSCSTTSGTRVRSRSLSPSSSTLSSL
jgi:hypothetical protein